MPATHCYNIWHRIRDNKFTATKLIENTLMKLKFEAKHLRIMLMIIRTSVSKYKIATHSVPSALMTIAYFIPGEIHLRSRQDAWYMHVCA